MVGSLILNIITVLYEGRAGRRLGSEFLVADSTETLSDVFVSIGMLGVLFLLSRGMMWVNGAATILIALLVLRNAVVIFRPAVSILVDEAVLDRDQLAGAIMSHPDVRWTHMIRSRGKADVTFVDLHIGVDPNTTVEKAHDDISHGVKELLVREFPGIRCVTIHVEPDTEAARKREHSVFRDRDF